ncbi:hypothetical protein K458DRAFT_418705 [Lentithecium fluviatile CBS 122367]|uniref:Uncharacterized protein n=1 Tax=Lentithecium fluviatile CBS 122367 TaxID=1168545 RepID=A0A6G1J020_9PLEO|nr:hypothetical protein K458DRAFT_418705 [Lentithecium fluviatile CBS 122367]
MTWDWQNAKEKEEEGDDSSHSLTGGDDKTSYPATSVTPIRHNSIVTDSDYIYPTRESVPNFWTGYGSQQWGPSYTFSTSVSRLSALPDNTSSPTPTPLPTDEDTAPSSTSSSGYGTYPHHGSDSKQGPPIAVAAIVPIAALVIVGAAIFFCMRRRKKQKQIAAAQAQLQEMKSRGPSTVQPYVASPISPIPPARPLSRPIPPTNMSPTTPTTPQPVILGPISGSNNNYFTGIDTSDIMSLRSNERTGLGDPFADGNSLNEEPPPPYYPCSVAPLSRDTSLRVPQSPPAATSQTELIDARGQPVRSPFADPMDGDVVSEVSGPTSRQNRDDMSAVSDLSYQQDPVVGRSNV